MLLRNTRSRLLSSDDAKKSAEEELKQIAKQLSETPQATASQQGVSRTPEELAAITESIKASRPPRVISKEKYDHSKSGPRGVSHYVYLKMKVYVITY